jgi:cellulose biosynthesis protein BcsQ
VTSAEPKSRIITFYSYKGGTGRTMALANVGWILAATGHRVLLIDWDLEAPGLHRYLHPFLEDKELASTPGLVNLFVDFAEAARVAGLSSTRDEHWYESAASVLRYAVPIDAAFPEGGSLDFVPAGRQDVGYAAQMASFNWKEFYDVLGGGIFLEALKRRLRADYEYVLIDSRTGLSDTAGICTVQMPDELVVLFTLNQQSIKGAYAIADSAEQQRRKPTGEPSLRVWPVATRVEMAEKDRLEAARALARSTFQRFIRGNRSAHWKRAEVLYQPYYAYEEILATFADQPGSSASMLSSMEALTGLLTDSELSFRIPETVRLEIKARYERTSATAAAEPRALSRPVVYISYSAKIPRIKTLGTTIYNALKRVGLEPWLDQENILPGDNWVLESEAALLRSTAVLVLIGKAAVGDHQRAEIRNARSIGKRIIPVVIDAKPSDADPELANYQALTVRSRGPRDIEKMIDAVSRVVARDTAFVPNVVDPEDVNKGQFGGKAVANQRAVAARVEAVSDSWFRVYVTVHSLDPKKPLTAPVQIYLDPGTFEHPQRRMVLKGGVATYDFGAWGAFTVGIVADGGTTQLELDLSTLTDAPIEFREN